MKFLFWVRKLWQLHGPKRRLIIVDGDTAHPFTISFPGSEELTELCPFPKIYGWNGIITGTFVEWMNLSGIPTVGIEAGQHSDPESTLVAEHTLKILMIEQGLLIPQNLLSEKLHIKIYPEHTYKVVENVIVDDGESFEFQRPLKGFDALRPNEIIARDSNKIYYAPSEQGYHVLMPAVIDNIKSGISKSAYYLMLKI